MTKALQSRSLPLLLSRSALLGLLLLPACAASQAVATSDTAAVADEPLSPSPLGHYLAGRHAQAEHDLGAAADFMAFALSRDGDSTELLQSTYLLMASEGRMAEAARLAGELKERGADAATAKLTLALAAVKAGDLDAATKRVAELPSEGLGRFVTPLMQAWVALAHEGADKALAALGPLYKVEGFAPLYHLHLGLVNDQAGRAAAAEENYRAAVDAAAQPSFRLVAILGNFYQRQGRFDEARALYQKFDQESVRSVVVDPLVKALDAGADVPPTVDGIDEGIAEALFDLATVLYQENAGDLALVYDRMALDLRPDFPIAQVLLGDILTGEERIDEAITVYRAVPPASPLGWQVRLDIADGLDAVGKTDEAIHLLEAMTKERPEREDAPLHLGNLLRSHERFAEAAKAYDTAVDRIGELKPEHWSVLYFRGIARERSGQWSLAEKDFLKALELEPDHPYIMNYLAYSWVEKGENYDRALDMLRRAVDLRPQDGYIVDSLGWVLFRLGKYPKAVEYLERAVELNPTDPVINDHLGDAYWKVGRKHEARFQWERALNFDPEADQVRQLEAKIERGLAGTQRSGS